MNTHQSVHENADVAVEETSCHGVFECLGASSTRWPLSPVMRIYQKGASYLTWWRENLGWPRAIKHALTARLPRQSNGNGARRLGSVAGGGTGEGQRLGLQPGDLVRVKPIEQILATLNQKRRCRGLLWMTGMRKYCGKQYRVRRRVERIMLETNGELRTMKDTVLLEGVMCDGAAFGGCDRCCFHFWREAWLERVPTEANEQDGQVGPSARG